MTSITLNISPQLAELLAERARRRGSSVEETARTVLEKALAAEERPSAEEILERLRQIHENHPPVYTDPEEITAAKRWGRE
jgi:plasmid stability protein